MKTVLAALLLLVSPFFSAAQTGSDKRSDLVKSELQGAVASLKETKYSIRMQNGKAVKDTVAEPAKSYRYNAAGFITEEIYYELNDSISEKWTFSFDAANKQLDGNRYLADGYLIWNYTCAYDAAGNCTEVSKYEEGFLVEVSAFTYDSKGNCIAITSESEGTWNDSMRYDERNNVIENLTINPEGETVMHKKMAYDSNNNLTEAADYDQAGEVSFKQTFGYDKNNRETESTYRTAQGAVMERVSRSYDNRGNVISYISYKDNGDAKWTMTYTYEYDKNRNWTKKTDFADGKPVYITERKITYY
jgi:hypothetical protein